MELTDLEKLLYGGDDDEEDDSEENNPEPQKIGKLGSTSMRDDAPQMDSYDTNSLAGAGVTSLTNGGRPQRRQKSKKILCFPLHCASGECLSQQRFQAFS